jgi:hypothetical protein
MQQANEQIKTSKIARNPNGKPFGFLKISR